MYAMCQWPARPPQRQRGAPTRQRRAKPPGGATAAPAPARIRGSAICSFCASPRWRTGLAADRWAATTAKMAKNSSFSFEIIFELLSKFLEAFQDYLYTKYE